MSEVTNNFEREERYIVIKRKHLSPSIEANLRNQLAQKKIPTVQCAVVESDWPEYEVVWSIIEAGVTGKATRTAEAELAEARALLVECRRYVASVCQAGNIPIQQSPSSIIARIDALTDAARETK